MDVAWLEDFLTLIDCGGFSKAADRRKLSQPSFSRRMRALETWVGAELVDRSTHGVRLTAAGEHFREVAEETLRRLMIGREETRAAAHAASATLRFAATHVLSLTFFPPWLRALEAARPLAATIELTADHMVACERLMAEGRAQFLLCHHHAAAATRLGPDFVSIKLGDDVLLPVAAPALSASNAAGTAPQLAFSAESGMGRILAAAWAERGRDPPDRPIFTSHLAGVLTAMARDGRGTAWTVRSLVEEDLRAGRLRRMGGSDDEVAIEIRLWRPLGRLSAAAEAFWEQVAPTE